MPPLPAGDRKALIPHRIGKAEIYSDCKYPQKLFVRRRLADLGPDMTVFLGHVEGENPEELVNLIDTRAIQKDFDRSQVVPGSTRAVMGPQQFPYYLLRAFTKFGLNVLSKVCKHTRVDLTTFRGPVDYVFERIPVSAEWEADCGFVYAADVDGFGHPDKGHKIYLYHRDGIWCVLTSYFGGRIATKTVFPGPNHEPWDRAEITTPLRYDGYDEAKDWVVNTTNVTLPRRVRTGWFESNELCPTFPLTHVEHGQVVKRFKPPKSG